MTKAAMRSLAVTAFALAVSAVSASAQTTPPAPKPMDKMDHAKMEAEHGKSPWKELDAYHEFMMATWHPAKGKNDLAPLKAKAADMAKSAKLWADSKAPKGCDAPKLKDAVAKVNTGTADLAAMVAKGGADDATLKSRLSELHDTFEIVEGGCKADHGHK
ncbi:MAG: hypothetical protein H7Z40_03560 [Phycisphaerae bacterium]|nr:hypothetical protein [Gemmatimonadaceae bacterium]